MARRLRLQYPGAIYGQTYALNASKVHTDTAIDLLYGNSGVDWFFAQVSGTNKDQVKDKTSGKVITGL
jgi:hypothetical protein